MIFLYLLIYLKQFICEWLKLVETKEHKVIRLDRFSALIITKVNKVLIIQFLEKGGMQHYYLNNRIAKSPTYLISLFSSARIITQVNNVLINSIGLLKKLACNIITLVTESQNL